MGIIVKEIDMQQAPKLVYFLEYSDLEKLVNETFTGLKAPWYFSSQEECANDSQHYYEDCGMLSVETAVRRAKMESRMTAEELNEGLVTAAKVNALEIQQLNEEGYMYPGDLIGQLVKKGKLAPGNYMVNVNW